MVPAPGHNSGQAEPADVFSWGDYVSQLVAEHGSLAAVAGKLVELRGYSDDINSVERALRRLRLRGHLDGGSAGRRLLAAFGVSKELDARVRWMGLYHTRFADLPGSFCLEQLRLWNRPPVSESTARVWLQLGFASLGLRARDWESAAVHLRQAELLAVDVPVAARIERLLMQAYLASRRERDRVDPLLEQVGPLLPEVTGEDGACFHARWIDQRAYQLNNGSVRDHAGALALYEQIPASSDIPFVACRRHNGLAFVHWKLGRRDEALAHAAASVRHAGDGGLMRLRAMALNMLARIQAENGESARLRALAIARRLEDEELTVRIMRLGRADEGPRPVEE